MRAPSKYRAKPTEVGNIRFHSKGEAGRYEELLLLMHAGKISHLRLQPRFPINVEGQYICTYIADFQYQEGLTEVVEDFKGYLTAAYRLKAKLFRALYPQYVFRETHR